MAKPKQLRDQSVEELKAQYRECSKDMYNINNENRTAKKVEKPHLMRAKKRERAQVMTILREKGGERYGARSKKRSKDP